MTAIRAGHPSAGTALIAPEAYSLQCRSEADRLDRLASEGIMSTPESILAVVRNGHGEEPCIADGALRAAVYEQMPDLEVYLDLENSLARWAESRPCSADVGDLLESTAEFLRVRADATSLTAWSSDSR